MVGPGTAVPVSKAAVATAAGMAAETAEGILAEQALVIGLSNLLEVLHHQTCDIHYRAL